jgi:uncharacterized membrane protein
MERRIFYSILIVSIAFVTILFSLGLMNISGAFVGFGQPTNDTWWNISWHYRFRLDIDSLNYDRKDWPVEIWVNFTDLLPSGTFDENSVRIFEYNSTGGLLYEVPYQFDKDSGYDAANNAAGTLVFLLNGTTPSNTIRHFDVYYDTVENGAKPSVTYDTDLTYDNSSIDSDGEFNVTNNWGSDHYLVKVDTIRGENTSGMYHIESIDPGNLYTNENLGEDERTLEYTQFSNGTNDFTFNYTYNANFLSTGPIRIVVEQVGYETFWNDTTNTTGLGKIVKRYIFYKNNSWIKIVQNFTNIGSSTITRNSTEAGALAFDAYKAWPSGYQFGIGTDQSNQTNPYDNSWGWATSAPVANGIIGIINVNQTGTTNFYLTNSSTLGRIGIQLNSTDIPPGSSITHTAAFFFGGTWYVSNVSDLRDRLLNPVNITQYLPEGWYVEIEPSTNATIYNRNETILVIGNVTIGDPYNIAKYMNATLDMGTPSTADDQTIILYDDDNDRIFTNVFNLSNDAELGIWTINFTAYADNLEFLNWTTYTFNVTDVLNVSVDVLNPNGTVNRIVFANVYVKNYRQDAWIPGATINCSYDSSEVINKTDFNNGTYQVNFTAPSIEGNFTLLCNATKNNNFGTGNDTFVTEPVKTNVSITAQPSNPVVYNITLYQNGTFVTTANASNVANGTAYATNISLELLAGWDANKTLEECGDVTKGNYCVKSFNITVPNSTSPGNYYINVTVTWRNPDDTIDINKTTLNVTVASNPEINVSEVVVSGEVGDGSFAIIGNFTVLSIGNDALENITFNCTSGIACQDFTVGFTPVNISTLAVNANQSVAVNVSVPFDYSPGTYNGIVNVSAQNDGYKNVTIQVFVPPKTNVSIVTQPANYTSNNITQADSETFIFTASSTNIGNGSAKNVNVSLTVPTGWSSNYSTPQSCGNLTKGNSCSVAFNVTIANGTLPGNYLVNVTVNWTNPDATLGTNTTSLNVTVSPNPKIDVSETLVSGVAGDGTENTTGNFTVLSIGNYPLQNIQFNCTSGVVCQDFTVEFVPSSIVNLEVGYNQSVSINVTVPLHYPTGTYNGTINVTSGNNGYKNFTLQVFVPSNRTWNMTPTYCERSEEIPQGTACEVLVKNLGNDLINFTITPEEGNYTKVNVTNFTVDGNSNYTFSVTYNVTTPGIYNSTFLVDAVQPNANPDNATLTVVLLPYVPPIINISIVPNSTEQNSSVEIFVNITDQSNTGLAWAKINVTRPNGIVEQNNLTLLNSSGNLYQLYQKYPDDWGNTSAKGNYSVTVYAQDNIGNSGSSTSNFTIYTKLVITSTTASSSYLQGDVGSIYYVARDFNGIGLSGVNATFKILDSNQNTTYYGEFQTNDDGLIYPMPSFTLASDTALGTYTLVANSTYYEPMVNKILVKQTNSTFQVSSRTITVTGLFADIETAVVWYPENVMRFGILVYNGEGKPTDPTSMNLTVYDPAGNLYFNTNMSQMTKQSTGFYTYNYAMPSTTPSGMFLAYLNVTQDTFVTQKLKAFRVAHGGPYDLRITLLENEVPQGDYLDFSITIENKGEVSQDVTLQYWVSSQNQTFFSSSEAIYTPALSNQTFTRGAYIYSYQPLGSYILNVKVIYDTVQPAIVANASFSVVAKPPAPNITYPPITLPPTYITAEAGLPMPPPVEKAPASIMITNYRINISLARGMVKIESVTVKNTGRVDLKDVSLYLFGIPTTWYKITPESYKVLHPENSTVFVIEFNIPNNASLGDYRATLSAASGTVSDQKSITITIFQSIEEVLRNEIKKLKEDLQMLETDTEAARAAGKDVSGVLIFINETKAHISSAERNLENNRTEDAMANVANARILIDRARDLLSKLTVKGLVIPMWLIFLILILVIVLVSILVILLKEEKLPSLRPYIVQVGKIAEAMKLKKVVAREEMVKEREKLLKMLDILEKERSEGLVSGAAYKEMKANIEEKLKEIEKKLK